MTDGTSRGAAPSPALLRALGRCHRATRDIADDLLGHLPDLGDPATQRALDAWVDQAADTMLALTESIEERLLDARASLAPGRTTSPAGPGRHGP